GKFEIASTLLAENGYDPLPVYTEPGEGPLANPELAREYPLVFNSGTRTIHDFRTQHHGVQGLRDGKEVPPVVINRQDAERAGIAGGEVVWVESVRGRARYHAEISDDIVPGAIDAAMGGGGPLGSQAWQECNVNVLTDPRRYDPISGFPVYKSLLCRVRKLEGGGRVEGTSLESPAAVPLPGPPPSGTWAGAEESKEAGASCQIDIAPGTIPSSRRIYLDNNSTTAVAPEVREAMLPFLGEEWGNPSSIHAFGSHAKSALEAARRVVAQGLNCTARRIVFTGGGSEADNLALRGVAQASDGSRRHLIVSSVEHPAVLKTAHVLAGMGYELSVLPVNRDGVVKPRELEALLRPDTLLVSVMLANNETGALQPVRQLAEIAHRQGALFHCDAVQAFGKIQVDVEELGVDLLALSAHKLHGPKGVGALYVRKEVAIEPLVTGGGHEHGLRAGTENVPGIVGFGKAVELSIKRLYGEEPARVARLRDRLEEGVMAILPLARRNGPSDERLPNTLNMILPEVRGESLVLFLDRKGIAFSSGSACKSGNPEPSHALLSMGLTPQEAHCSVRFSLGWGNTEEEIDYLLASLRELLGETRNVVRFVPCR
ncbi:IscS subfamily cysteine desulfurase, partial [Geomonas sp.]|uniref:IscS subfamily cysteine desulfurase n=1 Tax=Geomonas sp. TaxID=2651584 RepID=UPI002B46CDEE